MLSGEFASPNAVQAACPHAQWIHFAGLSRPKSSCITRSLACARARSLASSFCLSLACSHARALPCICTRCRCVRQVEAQRHPRALRVLSMSRGIACALARIQVGKMTLSLALVPAPAARGARGLRGARGRGAGNEGERARGARACDRSTHTPAAQVHVSRGEGKKERRGGSAPVS